MRGRISVSFSPWKIAFKFEVKKAMLPFMAHIHCLCCRRSIGPLPSSFINQHIERSVKEVGDAKLNMKARGAVMGRITQPMTHFFGNNCMRLWCHTCAQSLRLTTGKLSC